MPAGRIRRFFRWLYRNRSLSLTSEGKRFVLLALGIGFAAVNTGNNLLYLLLAMMLSLIVVSGLLSEQCLKRVSVQRRLPGHIFAGSPTTGYFSIANGKARIPSFSLHVMDWIGERNVDRGVYVLSLAPGASTLQAYSFLIPHRGWYRIGGVQLLTRFPFSLFIKGLTIPVQSEAVVYPPVKPLPGVVHDQLRALGQDQQMLRRGPGQDLYNLRLYTPSDDSRSIHWKTTARTNQLMVRETEAEDQRRVTLALPVVPPSGVWSGESPRPEQLYEAFERAVELAASVAAHFNTRGYALRALVGQQEIPFGSGEENFYRILRALALCRLATSHEEVLTQETFQRRLSQLSEGGFTTLVLPWDDPRLARCCTGASRILRLSEFEPGAA